MNIVAQFNKERKEIDRKQKRLTRLVKRQETSQKALDAVNAAIAEILGTAKQPAGRKRHKSAGHGLAHGSVTMLAMEILKIAGKAMSPEEVAEAILKGHSKEVKDADILRQSVKNNLFTSNHFKNLGKSMFILKERAKPGRKAKVTPVVPAVAEAPIVPVQPAEPVAA